MANYKALTPNDKLFFEQNIWDDKELAAYINAIKTGYRIKLDVYKDYDGDVFVKLTKAEDNEPIIQDYISFGDLNFFRRSIVTYAQWRMMAIMESERV
ncbi:TPA: hypothetical protein ACGO00_001427 [Streptococcus suis]|uniref:hypothetical protein n=1 Tax=Streptococcus TaxID=1301 RepID=UPI00209B5DDA|nr:hypothetical protein [Streptococcus suis]MCO8241084.1 hypothetical protein [Streptococcus suis]